MDFVAIDVETANADLASICQIGIAGFSGGQVAEEWKSYVDPQDFFHYVNMSIHGITDDTVAGAPIFSALNRQIRKALEGNIVVTHTAFDRLALSQAAAKCGTSPFQCTWLDSACVVRRAWQEYSRSGYGLRNMCDVIGYKFKHHDALEDAKASGQLLLAAIARTGLGLEAWLVRVKQPITPSLTESIERAGNPDGPLAGEVMVFTGALSLPRRMVADLAASVGCEVDASVTKHTTILVVGDQDIQRLNGHEKSTKHRKAEDLIRQGQPIRILRETDFRALTETTASSTGV
jgi:DNA polymerase-3 subunit epsilon